jgi:ribosomal protein L3 glutamine methyltransferase
MFPDAASELRTVRDLLRFGVSRMNEAGLFFGHGTSNAQDEAAYLISHALHLEHEQVESFIDARLTLAERNRILELYERRIVQRVPSAYLTGEAWLGDFRFQVDERVIVPRSTIAELLRDGLDTWVGDPESVESVLDLCTGSGCLAILLAHAYPNARIHAVELSPEALEVARANVREYRLEERISLRQGDLWGPVKGQTYDLIVSNPPYVNAESMAALPHEYRREPLLALAGGADGLDIVRTILASATEHLNQRGVLVVEIGHNREVLEQAYPRLPFLWLNTSAGPDLVFLLERANLF